MIQTNLWSATLTSFFKTMMHKNDNRRLHLHVKLNKRLCLSKTFVAECCYVEDRNYQFENA